MYFNSLDFAIFLPIVLVCYWAMQRRSYQNILLTIASYFFYAWWDWRFLGLLMASTLWDYSVGIWMVRSHSPDFRKRLLWLSVAFNIGLLAFFKYFNFFVTSFESAFSFFGIEMQGLAIDILLPIGISFYTFQTLSYTIDIYRKKLTPTSDLVAFAAFVSFFPQLVAGPIERATHLLPQFLSSRRFNIQQAVSGLRQILWGLFKKIVIADNAALVVNDVFGHSQEYSGSTLLLGAIFFSFQIYGDFSGYSDIAIGTARLFGLRLRRNFAFPYFSRSVREFWQRWHISLSTWFRDYLYIPLGGNREGRWKTGRNIFIVFTVSGLWHGANWTYVIWGVLHGLYVVPLIINSKGKKQFEDIGHSQSAILKGFRIAATFALVTFAWLFFRAESLHHALAMIDTIFSKSLFETPFFIGMKHGLVTLFIIVLFMVLEWKYRDSKFVLDGLCRGRSRIFRWVCYYILVLILFWFAAPPQQFVYFQF